MNSTSSTPARHYVIIAVAALLAVVGGAFAGFRLLQPQSATPATTQATYLPGGKPLRPFELIDHHGEKLDNQRLQNQWSLVFFGYTYCPDACPTALSVLNAAAAGLKEKKPDLPLQVVMISVDPKRDTPARLAEYVPYFNEAFIGATGSEEALSTLARDLGILYQIHEPKPGSTDYLVDHSTSILLLNPRGDLQAIFGPPHTPQPIVDDILSIQGHYRS